MTKIDIDKIQYIYPVFFSFVFFFSLLNATSEKKRPNWTTFLDEMQKCLHHLSKASVHLKLKHVLQKHELFCGVVSISRIDIDYESSSSTSNPSMSNNESPRTNCIVVSACASTSNMDFQQPLIGICIQQSGKDHFKLLIR